MKAFVAMPFNPAFLPVWKCIKKSCEENGISPCRVDQIPQLESIYATIFEEIENSDLVIVDFSGDQILSVPNPNVVTEAKHAKDRKVPVVILTQSTDALPFDWRVNRAIVYQNDGKGLEYLKEVLTENLEGLAKRLSGKNKDGGSANISGNKKSVQADEPSKIVVPSGFLYIKDASYSCGGQSHTVSEYVHEATGMEFVLIPGGTFQMGDINWSDSQPIHKVSIKPFLMGKYEVTQKVWQKVMGNNPSNFKGENNPVEQVSWETCKKFCEKTGLMLPTEAQWEYACRAGTTTKWYWGDEENKIADYAWYDKNSNSQTHPVGQKKPNAFGLYDMSGNVWEWVEDNWHDNYNGASADGSVWLNPSASLRVSRGGSWCNDPDYCRSGYRSRDVPSGAYSYLGFRPSRPL